MCSIDAASSYLKLYTVISYPSFFRADRNKAPVQQTDRTAMANRGSTNNNVILSYVATNNRQCKN